jgi:hypothetical protein
MHTLAIIVFVVSLSLAVPGLIGKYKTTKMNLGMAAAVLLLNAIPLTVVVVS